MISKNEVNINNNTPVFSKDPHSTKGTSSNYRYLELMTGLFVGLLIISNLSSTRVIAFGPLTFDAGTLIFPMTYIIGDLLTEVYGFARSRRIIWTAFFVSLSGFCLSVYCKPVSDCKRL